MSTYNELIKNFERIRAYMREFYVYGFKSRDGYDKKSARSYDDERRRIESWLGDHMSFVRTPDGKNVFISIDSRSIKHNPFYNAWKAKSFTDGDITLHFILFDILHSPSVSLTLPEIMEAIDCEYLSQFSEPLMFDESTVRKKLKEYVGEGIIITEKTGRRVTYRRTADVRVPDSSVLDLFSEIAPVGVVGSFLLDKSEEHKECFAFKHHYIMGAIDSGVMAALFTAMREKRAVTADNLTRRHDEPKRVRIVPLRIFISVQNGREHLIAYYPERNCFLSYRIDYLSNIKLEDETPRFDELRDTLDGMQKRMWGVSTGGGRPDRERLERVEFTVRVEDGENYIVSRLEREKRVGTVEKIDDHRYRFSAEVYDSGELIPWIRTFICRIESIYFSNRTLETNFKRDIRAMYRLYCVGEEERK